MGYRADMKFGSHIIQVISHLVWCGESHTPPYPSYATALLDCECNLSQQRGVTIGGAGIWCHESNKCGVQLGVRKDIDVTDVHRKASEYLWWLVIDHLCAYQSYASLPPFWGRGDLPQSLALGWDV